MGKKLIIPGADFSINAINSGTIPVEYTLQNGFASAGSSTQIYMDNNSQSNLIRVRTNQLSGSYIVKTKTGYTLRAIVTYSTSITDTGPGIYTSTDVTSVANVQGATEFTLSNDGKYSIITFCKTDATAAISSSEDIVDDIIRP